MCPLYTSINATCNYTILKDGQKKKTTKKFYKETPKSTFFLHKKGGKANSTHNMYACPQTMHETWSLGKIQF